MLTEQQLFELCDKHNVSEPALAIIRHIRSSDPSRNVRSGSRNVATHFASRKMGCVIKAEASSTELATLFHWEHDPHVHEFYDQPPTIKKIRVDVHGRTRASIYTPDFFTLADDFIGWVECKDEHWLIKQESEPSPEYKRDEQGRWRCPAAERYTDGVGLSFLVCSSADTNPIVTQNLSDLSDYFAESCEAVSPAEVELAMHLVGDKGWCWLRDLIRNTEGLTVDAIYKMIVDGQLAIDLSAVTIVNEPHRARVFKNRALLKSSSLWLPSLSAPPSDASPSVELKCGTPVLWNGNAFEIVNVGDSRVYLTNSEMQMVDVRCEEFELLVGAGEIYGVEEIVDPRLAKAGELLANASDEDIESAKHRYYCLHPERCPDVKPHKASDRSIRAWRAIVRDRGAELGNEFAALIPRVKDRGNRRQKIDPKARELMREVITGEVMGPQCSGYFIAWGMLTTKCGLAGVRTPSFRTFAAEIARLNSPVELKCAREGEKAAYGDEIPYLRLERTTPKHGCRDFDVAHIDHTEMDLQFVDENHGRRMKKAWLTVLIDAYTRVVLAWVILFDEPSYRSCMLVIRDCVRRHNRFPKTVVADQGKEFKGKYFETLLAYMGSHKRMRPASKPRFGSIIERFFGKSNTEFIHALTGNNQALQSPRSMSPTHDPRDLAIWNLRAFREAFEGFLSSCYHNVEHPALGVSPAVAMEVARQQSGARAHMLIPYDRNFVIATMPSGVSDTAKVQSDLSFKVNCIEYFSERLAIHAGRDLDVKYDPFDVSHAFVQAPGGEWIEAYSSFADQLVGRSEKEIAAISTEINELNSRTGQRDADRARALGDYITHIREWEGSLALETQVARDRELKLTYAGKGILTAPNEIEPNADSDTSEEASNVVPLKSGKSPKQSLSAMQKQAFESGARDVYGDFE